MDERVNEFLDDIREGLSDCCCAVRYGDICSDCGEHCGEQEEEL